VRNPSDRSILDRKRSPASTLLTAVDVGAEATAAELVTAVPQLVGDLR